MEDLELALLRRGVEEAAAVEERCDTCHRTPLIGERMYTYESGSAACELCRARTPEEPVDSHFVHGPAYGRTIRITDQRRVAD
jgi:hypothetical protein